MATNHKVGGSNPSILKNIEISRVTSYNTNQINDLDNRVSVYECILFTFYIRSTSRFNISSHRDGFFFFVYREI